MAETVKASPSSDEIAWPLEFPLAKSASVFGEDYRTITLREPTAADCLKFGVFDDQLNGNQLLDLIATLSGLTPATVRALPGTDMLKLSHKLLHVFHQAAK